MEKLQPRVPSGDATPPAPFSPKQKAGRQAGETETILCKQTRNSASSGRQVTYQHLLRLRPTGPASAGGPDRLLCTSHHEAERSRHGGSATRNSTLGHSRKVSSPKVRSFRSPRTEPTVTHSKQHTGIQTHQEMGPAPDVSERRRRSPVPQ